MKRNAFYWVIQIMSWSFVTLTSLKYSGLADETAMYRLIYVCTYMVLGMGISHLYNYIHESYDPENFTSRQFIVFPLLGSLTIGTCFALTDFIFFNRSRYLHGEIDAMDCIFFVFDNIWLVIPWFLFYHLYRFVQVHESRRQRILAAEKMLKVVELENLKKQLNPHFLFNALNSIKALTISDSRQARDAIMQLSDLLRLSLNLGDQQKAMLSEEIKLAQDYLALEKVRFDNRLRYEFHVQDNIDDIFIISMSLNTLIENAVKHGIAKTKNGGLIQIDINTLGHDVIIKVRNTGQYNPQPKTSANGIGLDNLRKRLELHYGSKASFSITNEEDTVLATIVMPF